MVEEIRHSEEVAKRAVSKDALRLFSSTRNSFTRFEPRDD